MENIHGKRDSSSFQPMENRGQTPEATKIARDGVMSEKAPAAAPEKTTASPNVGGTTTLNEMQKDMDNIKGTNKLPVCTAAFFGQKVSSEPELKGIELETLRNLKKAAGEVK